MSRRKAPSYAQLIRVMRLAADIAAHRDQPGVQRRLLARGMADIVGATVGFCFVCDGWRAGMSPRFVDTALLEETADVFRHYATEVLIPHTIRADPYCDLAMHRADNVDQVTMADAQRVDAVAERYAPFTRWGVTNRLVDGAVNWTRTDALLDGSMVGYALHRLDGDRPFSEADLVLMRLMTHELHRLTRNGWFALPEFTGALSGRVRQLPPRLQQVLSLVLAGRHAKGIAVDLSLSIHTVREHLQRLYRTFEVAGRDELMAMFLQPGPRDGDRPQG